MRFNKKRVIQLWVATFIAGAVSGLIVWRWILIDAECTYGTTSICPGPYIENETLWKMLIWFDVNIEWFVILTTLIFFATLSGALVYARYYHRGATVEKKSFFVRVAYVWLIVVLLAAISWLLYAAAY